MIIFKCDRCGRYIGRDGERYRITDEDTQGRLGELRHNKRFDICEQCHDEFKKWVEDGALWQDTT